MTAVRPCKGLTVSTGWTPRHDITSFTNLAASSPVKGVAQDHSNIRVSIVWEEVPVGIASWVKHSTAFVWIPAYRVAQSHHRCAHPFARSRCCHSMILLLSITEMTVKAAMQYTPRIRNFGNRDTLAISLHLEMYLVTAQNCSSRLACRHEGRNCAFTDQIPILCPLPYGEFCKYDFLIEVPQSGSFLA